MIIRIHNSSMTSLLMFTLITSLRYCFSAFSIVKFLFSPRLYIPCSLEGRDCTGPTRGLESYALAPSWGCIYVNYLEFFCMGDLSFILPFMYLVSHLFILAQTHEYLFYTLGCNPVLLYLVCCLNCSTFGLWELF